MFILTLDNKLLDVINNFFNAVEIFLWKYIVKYNSAKKCLKILRI